MFGDKICAIIFNEEIELTEKLKNRIENYLERMIISYKVSGFYFGKMTTLSRYCLECLEKIRRRKFGHIFFILCPCVGEADMVETIRFQYIDQNLFLDRSKLCAKNRDIHMIINSQFYFLHCVDPMKFLEEGKYIFSKEKMENIFNLAEECD